MHASARRTPPLRRVATTASLAALLIAPGAADAAKKKPKSPVITSVKPMKAKVGNTLILKGRHFRKGKGRNSVGFKRRGAAVVFLRADLSTTRTMSVKLTKKLNTVLYGGQPAVFRLRVLSSRFGRSYTSKRLSPLIAPRLTSSGTGSGGTGGGGTGGGNPLPPAFDPAGPDGDCDGDKTLNRNETGDKDNDLLTDALEERIGTNGCQVDSDTDGVSDAYEHKSAIDLNDDEYQAPNSAIPYPGARPYPNPLNKDDELDYDGDSLTLGEEFDLWTSAKVNEAGGRAGATAQNLPGLHLSYSDGLQHSVYAVSGSGHRVPTLAAAGYSKQQEFLSWATSAGYAAVTPSRQSYWSVVAGAVEIRDVNRDGTASTGCGGEQAYYDFDCNGVLADDERDADADGLTNYDETHGRITPGYWQGCYVAEERYKVPYVGTKVADFDSDNDGIRDGADDQDHDDLPNLMELSRMDASVAPTRPSGHDDTNGRVCEPADGLDPKAPNHPLDYGKVQPFDPCDPDPASRTCDRHPLLGSTPDPNWWSLQ